MPHEQRELEFAKFRKHMIYNAKKLKRKEIKKLLTRTQRKNKVRRKHRKEKKKKAKKLVQKNLETLIS